MPPDDWYPFSTARCLKCDSWDRYEFMLAYETAPKQVRYVHKRCMEPDA